MNNPAAAHGEFHVRSDCDSPWCGVSGEHSDRRIGVSFRANAAERAVVPYIATDTDDAPRRGGRQTHTRPIALVPRPAAAPERNVSQPDGVWLTPPCARRQVRHGAVAKRDAVGPENLRHPHHVVLSAPALQSRHRHLGAASDASLSHVSAVDRFVTGCWRSNDPPNCHFVAKPRSSWNMWAAWGAVASSGPSR